MYRVYVIELSRAVYTENAKFREANPQYNGVLECLYVGMTSKPLKERLKEHKEGKHSERGQKLYSNLVRKYGLYLRPSLYEHIQPMKSRYQAVRTEQRLALELRKKRYAVWWG